MTRETTVCCLRDPPASHPGLGLEEVVPSATSLALVLLWGWLAVSLGRWWWWWKGRGSLVLRQE